MKFKFFFVSHSTITSLMSTSVLLFNFYDWYDDGGEFVFYDCYIYIAVNSEMIVKSQTMKKLKSIYTH